MNQKKIENLIRDYLSGKNTTEGKALFDAWYASHDQKSSPLNFSNESEKESIRKEILAKSLSGKQIHLENNRTLGKRRNVWYMTAAVWVGFMLLGFGYYLYSGIYNTLTVSSDYAEVKTIYLPDSTKVSLNANTQIRYQDDWEDNAIREVWIVGEAFFDVVHTVDDRPFLVHASQLNVEVLGTEFNVNTREENTEVVLYEGSVKLGVEGAVGTDKTEVYMSPNELATFSATQQNISKKIVNPDHYLSWQNQELVLNNTTLEDIAKVLENYYGIEVIIKGEALANLQFSATARLPLKDKEVILNSISEIYNIQVTVQQKRIVFSAS